MFSADGAAVRSAQCAGVDRLQCLLVGDDTFLITRARRSPHPDHPPTASTGESLHLIWPQKRSSGHLPAGVLSVRMNSYSSPSRECPPQCEHCQCLLTVRQILVRCPHLQAIRDDVFGHEGVMESSRFHIQLFINLLRESFIVDFIYLIQLVILPQLYAPLTCLSAPFCT